VQRRAVRRQTGLFLRYMHKWYLAWSTVRCLFN